MVLPFFSKSPDKKKKHESKPDKIIPPDGANFPQPAPKPASPSPRTSPQKSPTKSSRSRRDYEHSRSSSTASKHSPRKGYDRDSHPLNLPPDQLRRRLSAMA